MQGWAAWDAVAVAGTEVPPKYRRRSRALASRGELSTEGGKVRVVMFGVDGMSPNGVLSAHTPTMHRMMKEGAYTMHDRSVLPTSSSPMA